MLTQYEWIMRLFPQPGFFVEAGAHDGIGDSQSWALERAGWDGICVEPSSAFEGLRKQRQCKVDKRCLWDKSGDLLPFWELPGNDIELSGVNTDFCDHHDRRDGKNRWVGSVTLPDLLRSHNAPKTIEYLCLDTEGSELRILRAHNFSRYRFLAICVEHNGVEERRRDLEALLTRGAYRLIQRTEVEDWYAHNSIHRRAAKALAD